MLNATHSGTFLRMCHSFRKMACYCCALHQSVSVKNKSKCRHFPKKLWVFPNTYRNMPGDITILVGTNELQNGGELYKVEKLISHSDHESDIGLIRVEKSIKFNTLVQPIEYSKEPVQPNSILFSSKLRCYYNKLEKNESIIIYFHVQQLDGVQCQHGEFRRINCKQSI